MTQGLSQVAAVRKRLTQDDVARLVSESTFGPSVVVAVCEMLDYDIAEAKQILIHAQLSKTNPLSYAHLIASIRDAQRRNIIPETKTLHARHS